MMSGAENPYGREFFGQQMRELLDRLRQSALRKGVQLRTFRDVTALLEAQQSGSDGEDT